MNRRHVLRLLSTATLASIGFAGRSSAQAPVRGVSPLEIRLGTTLGLTGRNRRQIFDYLLGFVSQIDEINSLGGVHNRQLTLFALDHGDRPQLAIRNTLSFLGASDVFSLVAYGDTDPLLRVLPLLAGNNIHADPGGDDLLLFGALSGAQALYSAPYEDRIYRLRPSYRQEAARLCDYLIADGRQRIGLCVAADATGQAIRQALIHALRSQGSNLAAEATCSADGGSIEPAFNHLRRTSLDTVVCAVDHRRTVEWLRLAQAESWSVPLALPSTVSGEALTAGLDKEGLADLELDICQSRTVPTLQSDDPDVLEFIALTRRRDTDRLDGWRPTDGLQRQPHSAAGLEGFLTARRLIAALDLAGPELSRASFKSAWQALDQTSSQSPSPPESHEPSPSPEPDPAQGNGVEGNSDNGPSDAATNRQRIILARAAPDGKWKEIPPSSTVYQPVASDNGPQPADPIGATP